MRLGALLAGAALATTALAGPASATSTGTVTWDGKRGADSIRTCDAGESPYLHWMLTPGGKANMSGAALQVDGETAQGDRHGNTGRAAIHFYTDFHDPATVTSSVATVVGQAGNNSLLAISDGCTGGGRGGTSPA